MRRRLRLGGKNVRWREGSKGWLGSRFVALRVQPSHGFVDGQPPDKDLTNRFEEAGAERVLIGVGAADHEGAMNELEELAEQVLG